MNQITLPEIKEGEIYAGAIIQPDGTGHHVILLPAQIEDVTHQKAMVWAAEQGGDLPNRVEQSLLFAHSIDQFDERVYWSNTQHASSSDCAWCQSFESGSQDYNYKNYEFRARAVRRLLRPQ